MGLLPRERRSWRRTTRRAWRRLQRRPCQRLENRRHQRWQSRKPRSDHAVDRFDLSRQSHLSAGFGFGFSTESRTVCFSLCTIDILRVRIWSWEWLLPDGWKKCNCNLMPSQYRNWPRFNNDSSLHCQRRDAADGPAATLCGTWQPKLRVSVQQSINQSPSHHQQSINPSQHHIPCCFSWTDSSIAAVARSRRKFQNSKVRH
jgi:hypothetical protein